MEQSEHARLNALDEELQAMRGFIKAGAKLYVSRDRQEMLEAILAHARVLTRAESGSLFVVQNDGLKFVAVQNDGLKFVAVQNDKIDTSEIAHHLLKHEVPISADSVVGFVAMTGRILNIPDTFHLDPGTPFRINRDFDVRTQYQSRSILAIPLNCPDGTCEGVLELLNHVDDKGRVTAFPESVDDGILAMASIAGMTVNNMALQQQLRQAHLNTIFRLSTVAEYRDDDTSRHIRRVSDTSGAIARAIGFDESQIALIKYSSPMHDVGKVAIPDSILLKPEHLTPVQRQVMQRHTVIGAEILAEPQDDVLSTARDIALSHHERWDGQGYPYGVKGQSIPLSARIVGLADVFDAIVSRRCYKAACSLDTAVDIIRTDTGKHFDPAVAKAFLDILDDILPSYPGLAEPAGSS